MKMRATCKRRSAEAEHRDTVRQALKPSRKGQTLKDLLLRMPAVGKDADFERPRRRMVRSVAWPYVPSST
jgi:plasmid stability protein